VTMLPSILIPMDGSWTAARGLGCATWLASRLGARLHILSATPRERPAREELERLHVPEEHWPLVELHQALAYPQDAILAAIARHDARLVVMTARGQAGDEPARPGAEVVGHVARAVLERCAVPVLLLPPGYREVLPWKHVLVPVSGGAESDPPLVLAVRLACALDLDVHVAHVAEADRRDEELAARARYADAIHHEYRAQLEALVSRAIPMLAPAECRRVRSIALARGDVAGELVQLIERGRISVLVVGWHGRLATGRAPVLKSLLSTVSTPVLIVTSETPRPFRLAVGEELE
jgi:nucleotide-binding universal stress UspA family protein